MWLVLAPLKFEKGDRFLKEKSNFDRTAAFMSISSRREPTYWEVVEFWWTQVPKDSAPTRMSEGSHHRLWGVVKGRIYETNYMK